MARLGTLSYPDIRLDEAVSAAERVLKDFGGEITPSGLAEALGMAERGGAFLHKVAGIKDYGLMEGRGVLRVTPLAERIIYPHSRDEEAVAKAEAFLKVELFRRLYERAG